MQNKITNEGPGNEHNLKHRKVLCGIQKKKRVAKSIKLCLVKLFVYHKEAYKNTGSKFIH